MRSSLSVLFLCWLAVAQECASRTAAVGSPDGSRKAYGQCALVVVTDAAGAQVLRSADLTRTRIGEHCEADRVEWVDATRVGLLCKYDPLVSDYAVLESKTGAVDRGYTGYWFGRSPDRKILAHVGLLLSVGSPEGQNSCLYFDGTSKYPEGCAFEQLLVKRKQDTRHALDNIHTFFLPAVWSPDSRSVAFVEMIFDFEYTDPYSRYWDGMTSNLRYVLVVAPMDGPVKEYPLRTGSAQSRVEWMDENRVSVDGRAIIR